VASGGQRHPESTPGRPELSADDCGRLGALARQMSVRAEMRALRTEIDLLRLQTPEWDPDEAEPALTGSDVEPASSGVAEEADLFSALEADLGEEFSAESELVVVEETGRRERLAHIRELDDRLKLLSQVAERDRGPDVGETADELADVARAAADAYELDAMNVYDILELKAKLVGIAPHLAPGTGPAETCARAMLRLDREVGRRYGARAYAHLQAATPECLETAGSVLTRPVGRADQVVRRVNLGAIRVAETFRQARAQLPGASAAETAEDLSPGWLAARESEMRLALREAEIFRFADIRALEPLSLALPLAVLGHEEAQRVLDRCAARLGADQHQLQRVRELREGRPATPESVIEEYRICTLPVARLLSTHLSADALGAAEDRLEVARIGAGRAARDARDRSRRAEPAGREEPRYEPRHASPSPAVAPAARPRLPSGSTSVASPRAAAPDARRRGGQGPAGRPRGSGPG
jgi:hypothetical protein